MTSLLASRAARRRSIAFIALLATTLLMMAVSSNPMVHDLQSALNYALRPIQGAVAGVASGVSSVVTAVGEIDRAIADYSEALRIGPGNASVHLRRGSCHGRKGEHERAGPTQSRPRPPDQRSWLPELIGSWQPVMNRASSDASHATVAATSSGSWLPVGTVVASTW